MAKIIKVLGQVAPAATTNTNLYEVPADTSAVVSTLVVANRGAVAATMLIWVRVAGAVVEDKQQIMPSVPVAANDSTTLTLGITLGATDIITVYAENADFSVNLFGSEIS